MKHKSTKRSISNKQIHHRSDVDQIISTNPIDLGTGTAHLDSITSCLKPHHLSKSQKLLKKELLRCSNQRPSLLGPQTLQPPRIHPRSQQNLSIASSSSTSSSTDRRQQRRRRSLSVHSRTFHATIDRIGPWPDISIGRLQTDGNDLLRPLKNFRNPKNPRLFSPKYYSGLNEHTSKFKFHSSQRTYMEEYRQQKGYLLTPRPNKKPQTTSLRSLTSSSKQIDDDQLSTSVLDRDRSDISMTSRGLTKSADDLLTNRNNHHSLSADQSNTLPALSIRNTNTYRSIRQSQHSFTLPAISTSFQYLHSMNSVDKTYNLNKKSSKKNESNLIILDGRQKPRYYPHLLLLLSAIEKSAFSILSRINSANEEVISCYMILLLVLLRKKKTFLKFH